MYKCFTTFQRIYFAWHSTIFFLSAGPLKSNWFTGKKQGFATGHCWPIHFVQDSLGPRENEALCSRWLYKTRWGVKGSTPCVSAVAIFTAASVQNHSRNLNQLNFLVASWCHFSQQTTQPSVTQYILLLLRPHTLARFWCCVRTFNSNC